MPQDNVGNFATSTLASPGIGPSDTSLTVATGQGSRFPAVDSTHPSGVILSIDSELILAGTHTAGSDTFGNLTRGYESTAAASHSTGATVIHGPTAGMVKHLWSVTADTFRADVPPYARGGSSPSSYDDEFETQAG